MRLAIRRFTALRVSHKGNCFSKHALSIATAALFLLAAGTALRAQAPGRLTGPVNPAQGQVLANHHPLWANPANDAGRVPANQEVGPLTLVLARSAEQEQAFEQLIADQQNPASPAFHQWLTPTEVGERFGLSDADIDAITGWLQAQGLRVNWIAPSRAFIGFSGTASEVEQAFGAEIHSYTVDGEQRISVASDPVIPQALAPAIKAVRGLYTIEERPLHHLTAVESGTPQITTSTGSHYIGPADFNTIYDVPASWTGSGETIGIVAESRTDMADFTNFKAQTSATFANPTEVIPTAFGGVDPGAACTTSGSTTGNCATTQVDLQSEATLDVLRSGSVAPGANLQLIVASEASGGIGDDAQYLVETTPVPANIMSISFGECESGGGSSAVTFWNDLFQQAASEGISVFVSSGDSGASGCDTAFTTPPTNPAANSPNSICSSSYATCVGGTEFNDTSNPSQYWSSTNATGTLLSALSYIPEGGWNEPGTSGDTQIASSGGGVSAYIPTPSWQTGTGVPAARAGRYTPDISFSASCHDGYFGCMAAGGGSCVSANGSFQFVAFCGTSAAAPGMAGVAALLDQKRGAAQGNLNQALYQTAASASAAFHDVTVSTSGVTSCSVNTPSMCNNSAPGPTSLTGGQAGYLVTTGYDEVTGLGSLDVLQFLNNYNTMITPTVTVTPSASSVTTAQAFTVTIAVSGGSGNPTPTGSVTLTSGSYTSAATTLASGSASISIPAGSLTVGVDTLTASYAPDSTSSTTYVSANGINSITVTSTSNSTPTVSVTPSASPITVAEALTVTVAVAATSGHPTPTGSVTLTGGGYTSSATTLSSGSASITVAAGSLAIGADTLTATYSPDSNSSSTYNPASGTATVTVTAKVTPTVTVSPSPSSITTAQSTTVTVTVASGGGYGTPTGSITLTGGGYTSAATTLASGSASITIQAGALAAGTDTLTATYTPDSTSSPIYNSASGTHAITVTGLQTTPTVSVTPSASQITTAQAVVVTVTVAATSGNPTPTGSVTLAGGGYTSSATTLSSGSASITVAAGSLAIGADTLTATYTPDSNSSSVYDSATGTATVTVTAVPSFALSGSSVSVAPGATSGNTSTITVTPSGGFTGAVTLTAAVTSSPSGAQDLPTLSFGSTTPVSITGSSSQQATLTISTTAATTGALDKPAQLPFRRYGEGGAALACILFLCIPTRRRGWRNLLGLFMLAVVLAGAQACGGGGGGSSNPPSNPGTTAGTYTITITGTSGTLTETGTVNLTVQ